jgi:hypothetical protein
MEVNWFVMGRNTTGIGILQPAFHRPCHGTERSIKEALARRILRILSNPGNASADED